MRITLRIFISACIACSWAAPLRAAEGAEVLPAFLRFPIGDTRYMKWGSPEMGTSAIVRYAFVKEPVTLTGWRIRPDSFCSRLVPFETLTSALPVHVLEQEALAALSRWSAVAGIRFVEVFNQADAELLIGAQYSYGGRAWTNLRLESSTSGKPHRITGAAVCLAPGYTWGYETDLQRDAIDVRVAFTHEMGHVLGLDHPFGGRPAEYAGGRPPIMGFRIAPSPDLTESDIAGAVALYGPRSY